MSSLVNHLAFAGAGFSIIALSLLAVQTRSETKAARVLALLLLCNLLFIQFVQALIISDYLNLNSSLLFFYCLSLGLTGPLFYLYSQHILYTEKQWTIPEGWHFVPAIIIAVISYLFPAYFNSFYSTVFLIGGLYMFLLTRTLYQLRQRRSLFKMEFIFSATFLSWAFAMVIVAMMNIQLIEQLLPAQTIMLTLAIAAAIHIQLNYPHILSSLEEIVQQYQTSTLNNIDCDDIKQQLQNLMSIEKIYQDSDLTLSSCAEQLSVTAHQLSELINTQLGMSFSAFLRHKRIKAAEVLLKTEPDASILSIGLSVGFRSQSAFYSAFKEIHTSAPGQFRRKNKL